MERLGREMRRAALEAGDGEIKFYSIVKRTEKRVHSVRLAKASGIERPKIPYPGVKRFRFAF